MESERKPKVSLVIPVYNVKPYLPACLNSVDRQTYRNMELILVDDGSTDGSGEILEEYRSKDRPWRVVVIHQENRGLGAARNRGIAQAGGDLISFLDSDDTLEPEYLEELVTLFLRTGSDIVCCNQKNLPDPMLRQVRAEKQFFRVPEQETLSPKEYLALLERDPFFPGTSVLGRIYRSRLFQDPETRFFDEKLEDMELTPKLVLKANHISLSKRSLYGYTIRQSSIMRTKGPSFWSGAFAAALSNLTEYQKSNVDIFPKRAWAVGISARILSRKTLDAGQKRAFCLLLPNVLPPWRALPVLMYILYAPLRQRLYPVI